MEPDRRIAAAPILIGLVAFLLLVPLCLYVVGYFYLGEASTALVMDRVDGACHEGVGRSYESQWLDRIFTPAGVVEEFVSGRPVVISHEGLHSYP